MKIVRPLFRSVGGVHPLYHKRATRDQSVREMPLPKTLSVAMAQHMGAPARPLVRKGDAVLRGRLIGERAGFVSAAVHAPTSGQVKAVGEVPGLNGRPVTAVEIEPDGADRWDAELKPCGDWRRLGAKDLVEMIAGAGIVGMGGAGFPTHVKLSPPPDIKINTLIVNGAECEPYLTADHRLMVEQPERIRGGVEIVRHILGAGRVVLAIEDNKPEAIQAMERAFKGAELELVELRSEYPQGAEKQLIHAVTGREVPAGGLPMNVGALVENVATCAAIYAAVVEGRPLIGRIVTVTGDAVRAPANLLARVGTPLADLVEACGGFEGAVGKAICGGPLMGLALASLAPALTKTTSGLVLLPPRQVRQFGSLPCIGCGRCVQACPMRLMPCTLSEMIEAEDYTGAEDLQAMDCIECGGCAYECPAHRPLVQHLRLAKVEITARHHTQEAKNN